MSLNILEHQEVVYNTLLEYLNKNRFIDLSKVVPFLSGRLSRASININQEGIVQILKNFVQNKIIVEGSMLVREEILDNPKRSQIYFHIRRNPGVYSYSIQKELNLSNHVIIWHLNMLLEFGCVRTIKVHNHQLYYTSNMKPIDAKVNYFLSNEKCKQILNFLDENNIGNSKTKLSKELRIHIKTMNKYLDSLEDVRLIYKGVQQKKTLYFINEEFYDQFIN